MENNRISKLTFSEVSEMFREWNRNNDWDKNPMYACIVFSEDNWETKYSLESRIYKFGSDNKYFRDCISNSILGMSIDGSDTCRLDWYMKDTFNIENGWKYDYCYICE